MPIESWLIGGEAAAMIWKESFMKFVFRAFRSAQVREKYPAFLHLNIASILIAFVSLLFYGSFAASAADVKDAAPITSSPSICPQAWPSTFAPLAVPGGSRIVTDFDGDSKSDIARALYTRGQYEIVISLSTRSAPVALNPLLQMGGFRLIACDINKDGFDDIVVMNQAAMYPQAAWLGDGKGGFTPVDVDDFGNSFGIGESPVYSKCTFPIMPDIWNESRHLIGENPVFAFVNPEPERNGFIDHRSDIRPIQNQHLSLSLRSPPSLPQF